MIQITARSAGPDVSG
ncbi:hypothetical protein [Frankia casuarinae]